MRLLERACILRAQSLNEALGCKEGAVLFCESVIFHGSKLQSMPF